MEGKPPLTLWFSHTGIIAYPPHCIQYLFSTPNTPLYSEIQGRIKLLVDIPFVYTVASNATVTASLNYTVPDGYIAAGVVRVSSLHNSILVCGFNQSSVTVHSTYAYSLTNYTGYATVLCIKKNIAVS